MKISGGSQSGMQAVDGKLLNYAICSGLILTITCTGGNMHMDGWLPNDTQDSPFPM